MKTISGKEVKRSSNVTCIFLNGEAFTATADIKFMMDSIGDDDKFIYSVDEYDTGEEAGTSKSFTQTHTKERVEIFIK